MNCLSLPAVPGLPPNPPGTPAQIEHSFFKTFSLLVARIKHNLHYDLADGTLLGIGGFQGFKVPLTRQGQAPQNVGLSLGRRFKVGAPLPAAGTAEIWSFVVQYVYRSAPFGQRSQPVSITVRG